MVVASDDDSGAGGDSLIEFTPSQAGTYYLAARASGYSGTGSYALLAYALPAVSIADAQLAEGNSGTSVLNFSFSLLTCPSSSGQWFLERWLFMIRSGIPGHSKR